MGGGGNLLERWVWGCVAQIGCLFGLSGLPMASFCLAWTLLRKDYVITHSVRSMYIVCGMFCKIDQLYPHTLMYSHGTSSPYPQYVPISPIPIPDNFITTIYSLCCRNLCRPLFHVICSERRDEDVMHHVFITWLCVSEQVTPGWIWWINKDKVISQYMKPKSH